MYMANSGQTKEFRERGRQDLLGRERQVEDRDVAAGVARDEFASRERTAERAGFAAAEATAGATRHGNELLNDAAKERIASDERIANTKQWADANLSVAEMRQKAYSASVERNLRLVPVYTKDEKGNQVQARDAENNPVFDRMVDQVGLERDMAGYEPLIGAYEKSLSGLPGAPMPAAPANAIDGAGATAADRLAGASPGQRTAIAAQEKADPQGYDDIVKGLGDRNKDNTIDPEERKWMQQARQRMPQIITEFMNLNALEREQGPEARRAAEGKLEQADPQRWAEDREIYNAWLARIKHRARSAVEPVQALGGPAGGFLDLLQGAQNVKDYFIDSAGQLAVGDLSPVPSPFRNPRRQRMETAEYQTEKRRAEAERQATAAFR
jgi:hypothetical protein